MRVLLRLLRHWRVSKNQGRRLFPASRLGQFHSILEGGMPRHQIRVRLAIEAALPTSDILRSTSARSRACKILARHYMANEVDRGHILIYINLADRQVEIVSQPGMTPTLTAAQWRGLCDHITGGFSAGDPGNGIVNALEELNALLEQASPQSLRQALPVTDDAPPTGPV